MTVRPGLLPVDSQLFPPDAWEVLGVRLTEERRQRMMQILAARTAWARLVVQDVHDPHNVSACLRSAEAFGFQCVDVVNVRHKYKTSGVARGSERWLTLRHWQEIGQCADRLHQEGYKIAVAYPPGADSLPLATLPLDKPLAIVFGNEHAGADKIWDEHLDYKFTIPMVGMVESLNISVSAAISLFTIRQRIERELASDVYRLSAEEQKAMLNRWICLQTPHFETEYQLRKNSLPS